MITTRKKMKEAKRILYLLLLNKTNEELTETEIDLMYDLSKDKDIQDILRG